MTSMICVTIVCGTVLIMYYSSKTDSYNDGYAAGLKKCYGESNISEEKEEYEHVGGI